MRPIPRPSASMVVACLALGVALSGTAVAASVALAPNSVGTAQLQRNAVTSIKVKNGSLLRGDFKAGQLPAGPPGPAGKDGAPGPAGAAGPSDAYARFVPGPVAVPAAPTTLASLTIPQAGKYVVTGKAYVSGAAAATALCRLVAGTDQDTALGSGIAFTLASIVVHDFAAAGSVDFQCATGGTLSASQIRIAAIRVASLTAG